MRRIHPSTVYQFAFEDDLLGLLKSCPQVLPEELRDGQGCCFPQLHIHHDYESGFETLTTDKFY